jgi:hypothetical protein
MTQPRWRVGGLISDAHQTEPTSRAIPAAINTPPRVTAVGRRRRIAPVYATIPRMTTRAPMVRARRLFSHAVAAQRKPRISNGEGAVQGQRRPSLSARSRTGAYRNPPARARGPSPNSDREPQNSSMQRKSGNPATPSPIRVPTLRSIVWRLHDHRLARSELQRCRRDRVLGRMRSVGVGPGSLELRLCSGTQISGAVWLRDVPCVGH